MGLPEEGRRPRTRDFEKDWKRGFFTAEIGDVVNADVNGVNDVRGLELDLIGVEEKLDVAIFNFFLQAKIFVDFVEILN